MAGTLKHMSHRALGPQWKPTGLPESGGTRPPEGNGQDSCAYCGAQFEHGHDENEIWGYRYHGDSGALVGGGREGVWPHLDAAIQKQYRGRSPFGNPNN